MRLLRAEYALVGFQSRDELTVLRDFCHRTAAGDRTGLAVITGIGGCGKTRLALELAHRLRAEGWYAGILPKGVTGVGWLAEVVSPVLVVLDYADGRVTDATALLAALRDRRGAPAVVLLTARALDGDWLASIVESLDSDAHPYRREDITLPDTHPHPGDVYHRTVTALTPATVQPPTLPQGIRWTTLDYVLLGWIAAQGTPTLPTSRDDLYDQALEHEQNYWCTVYRDIIHDRAPRRARLRKAAACLSLVAAPEQHADAILTAVSDLRDDPRERQDIRDTLITCLRPAPGEGLALRPDPVGDHLLLRELAHDDGLLPRTLDTGGDQGLGRALVTLVRAGQNDPDTATRLITSLLDADITRWPAVLAIAAAQGDAAASSLEQLALRARTPLPLEELSAVLPFSSLGLYRLALIVDQRLLDTARATGADQATIAELLLRVSTRASDTGDRGGALASITEAVERYRELATANPAAYLPNLATSLNNLSGCQSETGDRAGALTSITEAVERYRELATANPAAYLPNLATSLNNLSGCQSETGDRAGALTSITEAVERYRELATANPAAYLPNLATSLNNLSGCQSETGDRGGALASITEAVSIRRELATANPAAYLPNLAGSLNNLSNRQSETGDRGGALASIIEAVSIRRELATANPAAYLPNLAGSLNNLSNRQSETGDRGGALASIIEAVSIRRELATANPAAYLPNLATSLNNLSNRQSETGDRGGALASIIEAVSIRRELATANPAAYLPNLATSLNNLSGCQSETGDRGGALASITEAVSIRRELATANPAAYLPNLATSLNNLSGCQSETGDRGGALASITEAVSIRRELATANPAAYLPNLATSLNNLSGCQSETGDRGGALASITEAVSIRRELATANPAAYLPNLATSLNNLSGCQSETGDRGGALASITEAVSIRRELATANPAAYLPNLATSLNNLSDRLADVGQAGAIPLAWYASIDTVAHPAARAELRAVWARRLSVSGQTQHAWEQLHHAAADADLPPPDQQPPDRMSIILTMRARQAVRALAQNLGPLATDGLPIWASAPLPEEHLDLVNAYAQATDWPTAQAVLNDHREILTSPQFPTTLTALAGLYLTNPVPGQLLRLLAEIDESGIDTAFTLRHADHQRHALLAAWINTPTWPESLDYYRQHHTDLTAADTRAILASIDDDTARQHLAILDLTGVMPPEQVYSLVTDPAAAEDAALDALEHADLVRLAAIATATTSALHTRPSAWGLVRAVLLIATDQSDLAYDIAHQLAEQASPLQRRAHTIRLRALRTHHPDLPCLDQLIEIINPDSAAT